MARIIFISILLSFFTSSCKDNSNNSLKNQNITAAEAANLHKKGYLYIDLRTPEEIKHNGKINGAIEINFSDDEFEKKISMLPKSKRYIAYCASGRRSDKAMATFLKYNIEAYNMLAGYEGYKKNLKLEN